MGCNTYTILYIFCIIAWLYCFSMLDFSSCKAYWVMVPCIWNKIKLPCLSYSIQQCPFFVFAFHHGKCITTVKMYAKSIVYCIFLVVHNGLSFSLFWLSSTLMIHSWWSETSSLWIGPFFGKGQIASNDDENGDGWRGLNLVAKMLNKKAEQNYHR